MNITNYCPTLNINYVQKYAIKSSKHMIDWNNKKKQVCWHLIPENIISEFCNTFTLDTAQWSAEIHFSSCGRNQISAK